MTHLNVRLQTGMLLCLAAVLWIGAAAAQVDASQRPSRLSDEQLERVLERIEKGTDRFKKSFKAALNESHMDGSRGEDNVNKYIADFEDAADRLEKHFGQKRSTSEDVQEVLERAARINHFMERVPLTERAQNDWRTLKTDLDALALAYGVSWQWRRSTEQ